MSMSEQPTVFREQTRIPDPAFPINMFHVRPPDAPIIPPHWHEHAEWMLIRSGSFRVQLESRSESLGPGCVIFVAPQSVHSAFPLEEGAEILAVVFGEALVRSAALDDAELHGALPLLRGGARVPFYLGPELPAARRIASALRCAESEFRRRPRGFELFVKAALIECLGELRRLSPDEPGPRGSGATRAEAAIASLLRRLCLEYMESLSIDEAAAECGLSVSHFCHAFKKATGKTLVHYLRDLRMAEAERLLATTDISISAIAASVGFEDPAYFGRVFRAVAGESPRDARNHAGSRDRSEAAGLLCRRALEPGDKNITCSSSRRPSGRAFS